MSPSQAPQSAARRRIIAVFLTQGLAGLAVMLLFTYLRHDQTRIIIDRLGSDAPIVIAIAIAFTFALAILKFELTSLIFVSLVITAAIAILPLLGGVMTAWIIVSVGTFVRWLSISRFSPWRTDVEDRVVESVKAFAGQFGTYGIPIILAATLYERIGGTFPLLHATP